MTISEPTVGGPGNYRALYSSGPTAVEASSTINVTLAGGEESWTQEGLNALFQELIDLIATNPKFEFQSASWNSGASSTITLTPPPEEPAPEG